MIKLKGNPELLQWETNRVIEFEGQPDILHWQNIILEEALPIVPDTDSNTKIPPELLQVPAAITVFALKDGEVIASEVFGVTPRKKPLDYIYTPSDVQSLKDLAERVKLIEESGGLTDEQVENAFKKYLEENPIDIDGGTIVERINEVLAENEIGVGDFLTAMQAIPELDAKLFEFSQTHALTTYVDERHSTAIQYTTEKTNYAINTSKSYTDKQIGDINSILATLVDVGGESE